MQCLALVLSLALSVLTVGVAQADGARFGAVEAFFAADAADAASVRWSRILVPWERVQPEGPESWNLAIADGIVDDEVRRGRELVGVLVNTPRWAAETADRHNTAPPRGLFLPISDPQNVWASFARRVAAQYRDRIDTWIIWNEPDVTDPHHAGYAWSGTTAEFVRMQRVAYQAVREGNPRARLLLPGATYWWDVRLGREQFLARYLAIADKDPEARANGHYFDAVPLQIYTDPFTLFDAPRAYRSILDRYALTKPIWITETNAPIWDDPDRPLTRGHWRATQREQAAFIVQGYALALAAGVERISLYKMTEPPTWVPGWETYGLVRPEDGAVRPGYHALQTVHRLFGDVTGGQVWQGNGAVVVQLQESDRRILVAWSRVPRALRLTIPAVAASATVHTADGGQMSVSPTSGVYRLDLDPATHDTAVGQPGVYLVGGSPLIIVEPATEPRVVLTAFHVQPIANQPVARADALLADLTSGIRRANRLAVAPR